MARQATNELLQKAKKSKSDEFYTQLCDIERELIHYPDSFRAKVVYCNCDDARVSNFYRYFKEHFETLGLKALVASCYIEQSHDSLDNVPHENAFYYIYKGNIDAEEVHYFKGDGDFRSRECEELLQQADVVVTNPPFSLFREFISQIVKYGKQFLVIGNVNAITYKEIFETQIRKENE